MISGALGIPVSVVASCPLDWGDQELESLCIWVYFRNIVP